MTKYNYNNLLLITRGEDLVVKCLLIDNNLLGIENSKSK